jgi:chromosome segregation ATPase
MANDKININELVNDDDDPTAELEALVPSPSAVDTEFEAAASTAGYASNTEGSDQPELAISDLKSDLMSRSETIDRLQFDLELLRAKWQGLATEIQAREQLADKLSTELRNSKQALQRKKELVKERDDEVRALKSEIKQRTEAYRDLPKELATLSQRVTASSTNNTLQGENILAVQAGQLASDELQIRELQARITKNEDYADQLRYLLRVRDAAAKDFDVNIEIMEDRLQGANVQIARLQKELSEAQEENTNQNSSMSAMHGTHADEIRMIRFELGDAQATLSQHELVAEQLASDLVQTRSYRLELENMLTASEENSSSEISRLEKENRRLLHDAENMRDKLRTKSDAINGLLAELAKNSQQSDPVDKIEEAIQEIDHRMSETIEDRANVERERVTRVLTGTIDGQELRFPLFKDRLTIGRTHQNDIQLKSEHISRRHAVVVIEGDVTRVIDWGSKNGVFVNSKRVKEHFLKNNDIVSVGAAEFRYEERPKRDY